MTTDIQTSYYEQQTIRILEFDKIKEIIIGYCLSEIGVKKFKISCLSNDEKHISLNYRKLNQFELLKKQLEAVPIHSIIDCSDLLSKMHIENFFIESMDLLSIRNMCSNIREIKEFFKRTSIPQEIDSLINFSNSVFYDHAIERAVNKIIENTGEIKSDASPELSRIRTLKSTIHTTIDRAFISAFKKYKSNNCLHEIGESIRHGRRVLAVLAESKRSVKGIILDESETGKIVFIEPSETIFLNNEAFEIEREEYRELRNILIRITKFLAEYKTLITSYQDFMAEWDVIQAKNKFSNLVGCSIPKISNKMKLHNAFHPLLQVQYRSEKKTIVPFSLPLIEYQMLMISGPNAGGKSIVLMTIGLIALMVKSSIPIPAEFDSEFPIFTNVIGDIGDLQSLQDELSTYSSKLKLWNFMMTKSSANTLLLFDELGSGTDPSFGASMAQAILENCLQHKPVIIATTHYSDLKKLADERNDILNASMLFDEVKLEPMYQLVLGKPGSSYTFHIAKKIGVTDSILRRAENLSQTEQVNYEKQLLKLGTKEKELHLKSKDIDLKERELKKQMKDWNRLHLDLDLSRKKVKYEKLLHNQEVENNKKKELNEYKDILKQKKLEELAEEQRKIEDRIQKENARSKILFREIHHIKSDHVFHEGDTVQYIQSKTKGIIDKIQKNKAIVLFENMKSTIPLSDLIPTESEENKKNSPKKITSAARIQIRELDLRGKYVYEALPELEDFINQALLHNFQEIKIIHGKGKLKSEIGKSLQSFRSVTKTSYALPEHGGDGVTYVYF